VTEAQRSAEGTQPAPDEGPSPDISVAQAEAAALLACGAVGRRDHGGRTSSSSRRTAPLAGAMAPRDRQRDRRGGRGAPRRSGPAPRLQAPTFAMLRS
jgi:hypothetical protein